MDTNPTTNREIEVKYVLHTKNKVKITGDYIRDRLHEAKIAVRKIESGKQIDTFFKSFPTPGDFIRVRIRPNGGIELTQKRKDKGNNLNREEFNHSPLTTIEKTYYNIFLESGQCISVASIAQDPGIQYLEVEGRDFKAVMPYQIWLENNVPGIRQEHRSLYEIYVTDNVIYLPDADEEIN